MTKLGKKTTMTKFTYLQSQTTPLLHGMNSYTKFEENRSINTQDRARKRNFNVNQGP